jgi:CHAD domain-containing protein
LSFQFKADLSTAKNVRRLARKQIDKALEASEGPDPEKAVHDVRRRLKKLRALLRLARPGLGRKTFRHENACFRDAGRLLRDVRDARALISALDNLTARFAKEVALQPFMEVYEGVQLRLREITQRVLDEEKGLEKVAEVLGDARRRVKRWRFDRGGWSLVAAGLKEAYKSAARSCAAAGAEPTVDHLHECRKQTKYLWHQLQLLRPLNPARVQDLANQAKALSDHLGEDHDLALLHELLAGEAFPSASREAAQKVLPLNEERRAELQRLALDLGERFFQEKPRTWIEPLRSDWVVWRAEPAAAS